MSTSSSEEQQPQGTGGAPDFQHIQAVTKCNWCRNDMIMSEPISDANFIATGRKAGGADLYALYCSDCLAKEDRVKQPKTGLNKQTLAEFNLADLPQEQQSPQPAAAAESL
jgi:hypothetical protein